MECMTSTSAAVLTRHTTALRRDAQREGLGRLGRLQSEIYVTSCIWSDGPRRTRSELSPLCVFLIQGCFTRTGLVTCCNVNVAAEVA